MQVCDIIERILGGMPDLYETWKNMSNKDEGEHPKGIISACLVLLRNLKRKYDLDPRSHRSKNGTQMRGASGKSTAAVLAEFGETRRFTSEGGRTNRSTLVAAEQLLDFLGPFRLDELDVDDRNAVLTEMQRFLVDKVVEFHGRQRLTICYDRNRTTWQNVHDILTAARQHGCAGPVAQYLVGAKLQLRFPDQEIGNESYSTADVQLGRSGDFIIGDTAFHVTVAPQTELFRKCVWNLEKGLRPYVLVPDDSLAAARQMAKLEAGERVSVESIESFVGQNVDELSEFSAAQLRSRFLTLLTLYNERVGRTEMDKSMIIEIPGTLER